MTMDSFQCKCSFFVNEFFFTAFFSFSFLLLLIFNICAVESTSTEKKMFSLSAKWFRVCISLRGPKERIATNYKHLWHLHSYLRPIISFPFTFFLWIFHSVRIFHEFSFYFAFFSSVVGAWTIFLHKIRNQDSISYTHLHNKMHAWRLAQKGEEKKLIYFLHYTWNVDKQSEILFAALTKNVDGSMKMNGKQMTQLILSLSPGILHEGWRWFTLYYDSFW